MRAILAVALLIWVAPAALAAGTITGVVRNQSRGQPAVGDDVILLRFDEQLHEEARARTDLRGAFTLNAQYPGKPYLVRVLHQNVNYDQPATAGSTLSIQVFDVSAHVADVTGTIEILRVGTKGNSLHVSDMYELVNSSNPPWTQAGERTVDVYLPANARINSVIAAGPEKLATMISATRVSGEPGHYSVNFPLRPGATKFAFNYDLPYNGRAAFRTKHNYPLRQFAVMIPPEMKFASSSPSFQPLATGSGEYQVRAANLLQPGDGPAFEVSGSGVLPAIGNQPRTVDDQPRTQAHARPFAIPDPTSIVTPRPSFLPRINPPTAKTFSSLRLLIWTGITCLLLVACALIVSRVRRARAVAVAETRNEGTIPASSAFLQGLHHELVQLEKDRRDEIISAEEYASAKQAVTQTIKRALARVPVAS